MAIVKRYPQALTIFVHPGSSDELVELEQRLRKRGTESAESIARRLEAARRELAFADRYRYQVVNDDVERAVREICHIIRSP
jgi:guanylate kinase